MDSGWWQVGVGLVALLVVVAPPVAGLWVRSQIAQVQRSSDEAFRLLAQEVAKCEDDRRDRENERRAEQQDYKALVRESNESRREESKAITTLALATERMSSQLDRMDEAHRRERETDMLEKSRWGKAADR